MTFGLGLGLAFAQRAPLSSAAIAAPFAAVNGPASDPFGGSKFEGWSVNYASQPTIPTPVAFTVSRQGYDAAGTASTRLETMYVTKTVRQPYPNQASQSALTAALSDYIYSTDTPSGTVTNNSTKTSPKPVTNWSCLTRAVVGNTLSGLAMTGVHRNAQQGREFACVIFRATDGTNTVTSSPVTSTTPVLQPGDCFPVVEYRCPDLDITSLTAGVITVNYKAYPWVGGAASVLDTADQSAGREASPRYFWKDTAKAAAPPLAYVVAAGGNDTTGVWSTTAATAAATPFATIKGAFDAIADATRGTPATGGFADGCVIRCGSGTFPLSSTVVAKSQRCGRVTITRDPNVSKAACIITNPVAYFPKLTSGFTAPVTTGALRFYDVTMVRSGTGTIGGASGFQLELQLEYVSFDNGSVNATWLAQSHNYICGMTATNLTGNSALGAGTYEQRLVRGLDVDVAGGGVEQWLILGSYIRGHGQAAVAAARGFDGFLIGCSRIEAAVGTSNQIAVNIVKTGNPIIDGGGIFNVVGEWPDAATGVFLGISADGQLYGNRHICIHNVTLAGFYLNGRLNGFYDDGATRRTSDLSSKIGLIAPTDNTKSDVFRGLNEGDSTGTAIGNWPVMLGVGARANFHIYRSGADVGAQAALEYIGLNGVTSTASTYAGRNDPLFTNYTASTSSPTSSSTPAAGTPGGVYTLQSGSPARALNTSTVLSHDLAGVARSLTADSAGAYV